MYNQSLKISIAEEILATYIFNDEAGFSGCWIKVNKLPLNDCYWFGVKRISNFMFGMSDVSIWMPSILNMSAIRRKINSLVLSLRIIESLVILWVVGYLFIYFIYFSLFFFLFRRFFSVVCIIDLWCVIVDPLRIFRYRLSYLELKVVSGTNWIRYCIVVSSVDMRLSFDSLVYCSG